MHSNWWLRSFAAAIVLVVLCAGAVVGGNGVGGIFNLGVLNTVNKVTTLRGSASTAMLRVTNDGTGPALNLNVKDPGTAPIDLDPESTGRVEFLNADRLDGKDSTAFVTGHADITRSAIAIGAGGVSPVIAGPSNPPYLWGLGYVCPGTLTNDGTYRFLANPDGTPSVNLFIDQGLADPLYLPWPPGVERDIPANDTGEWVHIQVQAAAGWIADIEAFSVHRASLNDCHIQVVAVTTFP